MALNSGPFQSGSTEVEAIHGSRDFSQMAKKSTALRVLVVDDEPLIRWSLVETLAERGHEVVEAADGQSALRAVLDASAPFDVMLLDFRLPDSNDLSLLARLRGLAPRAQIVLMTAFGTPELTQGALELGAFRVISKPFAVNEMAALVQLAQGSRPS